MANNKKVTTIPTPKEATLISNLKKAKNAADISDGLFLVSTPKGFVTADMTLFLNQFTPLIGSYIYCATQNYDYLNMVPLLGGEIYAEDFELGLDLLSSRLPAWCTLEKDANNHVLVMKLPDARDSLLGFNPSWSYGDTHNDSISTQFLSQFDSIRDGFVDSDTSTDYGFSKQIINKTISQSISGTTGSTSISDSSPPRWFLTTNSHGQGGIDHDGKILQSSEGANFRGTRTFFRVYTDPGFGHTHTYQYSRPPAGRVFTGVDRNNVNVSSRNRERTLNSIACVYTGKIKNKKNILKKYFIVDELSNKVFAHKDLSINLLESQIDRDDGGKKDIGGSDLKNDITKTFTILHPENTPLLENNIHQSTLIEEYYQNYRNTYNCSDSIGIISSLNLNQKDRLLFKEKKFLNCYTYDKMYTIFLSREKSNPTKTSNFKLISPFGDKETFNKYYLNFSFSDSSHHVNAETAKSGGIFLTCGIFCFNEKLQKFNEKSLQFTFDFEDTNTYNLGELEPMTLEVTKPCTKVEVYTEKYNQSGTPNFVNFPDYVSTETGKGFTPHAEKVAKNHSFAPPVLDCPPTFCRLKILGDILCIELFYIPETLKKNIAFGTDDYFYPQGRTSESVKKEITQAHNLKDPYIMGRPLDKMYFDILRAWESPESSYKEYPETGKIFMNIDKMGGLPIQGIANPYDVSNFSEIENLAGKTPTIVGSKYFFKVPAESIIEIVGGDASKIQDQKQLAHIFEKELFSENVNVEKTNAIAADFNKINEYITPEQNVFLIEGKKVIPIFSKAGQFVELGFEAYGDTEKSQLIFRRLHPPTVVSNYRLYFDTNNLKHRQYIIGSEINENGSSYKELSLTKILEIRMQDNGNSSLAIAQDIVNNTNKYQLISELDNYASTTDVTSNNAYPAFIMVTTSVIMIVYPTYKTLDINAKIEAIADANGISKDEAKKSMEKLPYLLANTSNCDALSYINNYFKMKINDTYVNKTNTTDNFNHYFPRGYNYRTDFSDETNFNAYRQMTSDFESGLFNRFYFKII